MRRVSAKPVAGATTPSACGSLGPPPSGTLAAVRDALADAVTRGDPLTWGLVAALVVGAAVPTLLARSGGRPGLAGPLLLLVLGGGAAALGLALLPGLALPHVAYRPSVEPDLVAPGGKNWRRVRSPALVVRVGGAPELLVPTQERDRRIRLWGVLSGRPIASLPDAPSAAPEPGSARLCPVSPAELGPTAATPQGVAAPEPCRAWPAPWPTPVATSAPEELVWTRQGASTALAYDPESGMFLQGSVDDEGLDVVGRTAGDLPSIALDGAGAPPTEGDADAAPAAGRSRPQLALVVRRLHAGRFDAARVVATASGPILERSGLAVGRASAVARWVARPVLWGAVTALPFGLLVALAAPSLLRRRLERFARRHRFRSPLVIAPVARSAGDGPADATVVAAPNDAGPAFTTGASVTAVLGAEPGCSVAATEWYELPIEGSVVLVPADAARVRAIARSWAARRLHALAVVAAGLALAAPGLVAVVAMLSGR